MLKELHEEVVGHGMKHICIWQEIRRHFIAGSDKCGIFQYNTPRMYNKKQ